MKTLAVDIGNTQVKAAIFKGDHMEDLFVFGPKEPEQLMHVIRQYQPEHSVMSAVGRGADEVATILAQHTKLFRVTHLSKFPFSIGYLTPETLGMDRVAGVAAAQALYPQINCLVIDAGTCITYDLLTAEGVYSGGAISPGLQMRLRAMHEFTAKLPLPVFIEPSDFIGRSTSESLISGAFYGMLNEINETIARYNQRFSNLQVLLCGGDVHLFDKHIKKDVFAARFLVLQGLNQILKFNVQ
ncbi:type III pantothenate kinase [Nostoc sp. CHAB 5824]|nr:type III pantothenate kinase [Nostoc sp. CHAB 5824]